MILVPRDVHPRFRSAEYAVDGCWVIETNGDWNHPPGILICQPAPSGTSPDDLFLAKDGRGYLGTEEGCFFIPRNPAHAQVEVRNHSLEIEINGVTSIRKIPYWRKPTEDEARAFFQTMGFRVGPQIRFC